MAESHVLTGLIAKRAELAGQIEHTQDQLRQLVIDLDHIDASIHIFDPSIELEEIKARPVPPKHHAFRGEVTRIVLTTLRNAEKPLTTADIAQRVMAERGLDTANVRLLKTMTKRAGACLRNMQKQGSVASGGAGAIYVVDIVLASPVKLAIFLLAVRYLCYRFPLARRERTREHHEPGRDELA